ncbi:MAG: hypothetical protein MJA27_03960 [Pseudanabaenales cyanobacterium]|nr:hypothetical protein [Pseudanabaenales cyanobacterium]
MTKMESFVDPMAGGLVGILVDTAKKVGGNFAQVLGDRAKAYASLKHYANKYSACYGSLKLFGMQRSVPLETMAYILRREALQGNGSSPQEFQPILGLNFSRLKLYAKLREPTDITFLVRLPSGKSPMIKYIKYLCRKIYLTFPAKSYNSW